MHNRLIRLDVSQSAIALYIYRVGRSVPIMSENPHISHVKIQLLARINLFRLANLPTDLISLNALTFQLYNLAKHIAIPSIMIK